MPTIIEDVDSLHGLLGQQLEKAATGSTSRKTG